MNFLEFFADVIGSLAWPSAVGAGLYLLRDDFKSLLGSLNIRRLKYKEFEAEFEQSLSKAEKDLHDEQIEPKIVDQPISERSLELLDVDPKFAVLNSWIELEDRIRELSVKVNNNPENWSFRAHLMSLVKSGQINPEVASALQEMNEARNSIVHKKDYNLKKSKASKFIDLAEDVTRYLNSIFLG